MSLPEIVCVSAKLTWVPLAVKIQKTVMASARVSSYPDLETQRVTFSGNTPMGKRKKS
jgi:hypothetical protein